MMANNASAAKIRDTVLHPQITGNWQDAGHTQCEYACGNSSHNIDAHYHPLPDNQQVSRPSKNIPEDQGKWPGEIPNIQYTVSPVLCPKSEYSPLPNRKTPFRI